MKSLLIEITNPFSNKIISFPRIFFVPVALCPFIKNEFSLIISMKFSSLKLNNISSSIPSS